MTEKTPNQETSPRFSPDKEVLFTDKVEAKPVGDFYAESTFDFEMPDEKINEWEEYMAEREKKYGYQEIPLEFLGPMNYEPFDANKELKKIRQPFTPDPTLSYEENKRNREKHFDKNKMRLYEFKGRLDLQKEGVASSIETLRSIVEKNPNTTKDELIESAAKLAEQHAFTTQQRYFFQKAIEEYCSKHLAVEYAIGEFAEADDLYIACFGVRPLGKIELIKDPMTLYFKCYNEDDYVHAYNFDITKGDSSKLTEEMIGGAKKSIGCAYHECGLSYLDDTVMLENTSHIPLERMVYSVPKHELITYRSALIFLDTLTSDIDITVKDIGTFKLEATHVDNNKFTQFRLIDTTNGNAIIFDVKIESSGGKQAGVHSEMLRSTTDEHAERQQMISHYVESNGERHAEIRLEADCCTVSDTSPSGTEIMYEEDEIFVHPNLKISDEIHLHEVQHHFNKLFKPVEIRIKDLSEYASIIENARSNDEAVETLIRYQARQRRKIMGFDARARDEVLAHYRDGTKADQIYTILESIELYDYKRQFAHHIQMMQESIAAELEKNASMVTYGAEAQEPGNTWFANAEPLKVSAEEIQKIADDVLTKEYLQDLQHWINAIKTLESKGYERIDILDLLYQEPASQWHRVASRAAKKIDTMKLSGSINE